MRILALLLLYLHLGGVAVLLLEFEPRIPRKQPPGAEGDAAFLYAGRNQGSLPVRFEANQGQTSPEVRFLSRGPGYVLFLTPGGIVLALNTPDSSAAQASLRPFSRILKSHGAPEEGRSVLRMRLVNADPESKTVGKDEQAGRSHYFFGGDPEGWQTDLRHYSRVEYQHLSRD